MSSIGDLPARRGTTVAVGKAAAWLPGALIILAAVLAYHNSFSVPFLFDDDSSIRDNPTIRSLWQAWWPPGGKGITVSGRPLLNISFALNYALGGRAVWGYHAVNLAIHAAAACALFGVVRQTLLLPRLARRFGPDATWLALATALLWTVHPLQTEAVTYIVQRAESLVSLFYLLTMLCFIRAAAPAAPKFWQASTFLCCLLGMAAKEVMVTAPFVLVFYDRLLIAETWRGVWAQRGRLHLALMATWLLLAGLMISTGSRAGTAGFGTASSLDYALTQCWAVVHYLRLAVWPAPLVFDYGEGFITDPLRVGLAALVLVPLVVLSCRAVARNQPAGFCGLFFFTVLAPSSSVVPVATQTMAEHRVYLALAAPLALLVVLAYARWGRRAAFLLLAPLVGLTVATVWRNEDYRSDLVLWQDTVDKWPAGARAQANLGGLLALQPGRQAEAIRHLEKAIELRPNEPGAYVNLGLAWSDLPGREREARAAFDRALSLDPDSALAHANIGALLKKMPGRENEALQHGERALQLDPNLAVAHATVGAILLDDTSRRDDAIRHLRAAVRLDPELAEPHANLGVALADVPSRLDEAVMEVTRAVRLRPASAGIQNHFGAVLARIPGRVEEAIRAYETALRLDPASWEAHYNLGTLLLGRPARGDEAVVHFEQAARLAPENFAVRTNLGFALGERPGRLEEARREFAAAVRLQPGSADAHFNLGMALLRLSGHSAAASAEFRAVLALDPDDADAHYNLGLLLADDPNCRTEARGHLETALRLQPGLADAHYRLAMLMSVDDRTGAVRHLEAALGLAPDHSAAREMLAQLRSVP